MDNRKFDIAVCTVLFAALSACGGGGGSSSGNDGSDTKINSTAQFPIDSAISAYMQMSHDYTLHATDADHNKYILKITQDPEGQATFDTISESVSSFTTLQALTVTENGTSIYNSLSLEFFTIDPYIQVGYFNQFLGQVTVYDKQQDMPPFAQEGQSGQLDTGTTYANNNLLSKLGYNADSWDLQAGTGEDASLCINVSFTTLLFGTSTENDCYIVDTSGNVLGMNITMSLNGAVLTFK